MKALRWKFQLSMIVTGILILCRIQGQAQTNTNIVDSTRERLIDIGYQKLFISDKGPKNAAITIIFESGAGGSSQDWVKVREMLPPGTRTVAYDRAGVGKSGQGPLPRTMAQQVFELHTLLKAANIKGPFILVGQSIGGLLVRLYTEYYGKDVAGVVLLDPTHENSVLGSLKYGGWVRLREKATGKTIPTPQLRIDPSPGYDSTADYMAEEFQKIYLSGINNQHPLKHRPLVVVGAGIRSQPPVTPDAQWKELRAERDSQVEGLTNLSGNAKFIFDSSSSHAIQNDNPAIVVKAIEMVISSINSKTSL